MNSLLLSLSLFFLSTEILFAKGPSIWITRRVEVGVNEKASNYLLMVHFNSKVISDFVIKERSGRLLFPSEQMKNVIYDKSSSDFKIVTPQNFVSGDYLIEFNEGEKVTKRRLRIRNNFLAPQTIVVQSNNFETDGIGWNSDFVLSNVLDRDQEFKVTGWLAGFDGDNKKVNQTELETYWEGMATNLMWKRLRPSSQKSKPPESGFLAFYLRYDLTTKPLSEDIAFTDSVLYKKVIRVR